MPTSTVHAVLDRHGLVKRRKRRRYKAEGTTLSNPARPNHLCCCDYKGEFMLGNKRYCYPLTITDAHSRYLLACEGQQSTKEVGAFAVFEALFKEFGLPDAIRSDNGLPFASPNSLYDLDHVRASLNKATDAMFGMAKKWRRVNDGYSLE